MEKTKSKKKISGKELTWYIISGVIVLCGLAMLITGIVGDNLGVKYSDNPILVAQDNWMSYSHIPIAYRWWGLIIIAVGALVLIITLCVNAKKSDRELEKAQRRAQRLNGIVDGEFSEVSEEGSKEVPLTGDVPVQ